LILSTGCTSNNTKSNNTNDLIKYTKDVSSKIHKAKTIAVVGSGTVGIEFAGECFDINQSAKITLIGKHILSKPSSLTDRFRTGVKDVLKKININIIEKNVQIESLPNSWEERFLFNHKLKLDDNSEHEFDVVFLSNGYKPHFSYTINGNNINDYLKVNKKFEVEGYNNIYAIGDCNNYSDIKLAYFAAEMGIVLAHNIKSELKNDKNNYKEFVPPQGEICFLPIGKNHG